MSGQGYHGDSGSTSNVAKLHEYRLSISMLYHIFSKTLGWVSAPEAVLLIILIIGSALLWTRWARLARVIVSAVTVVFMAIAALPIGSWLLSPLEDRFAGPGVPPAQVYGIIVLGGSRSLGKSIARDQVVLNGNSERLTMMATLARRYPRARLVFTGGSNRLFSRPEREADIAHRLLVELGVDTARLLLERESRNTWENATNSFDLVKPLPGQTWLLITSARHMPRAMGAFRKAGWQIQPYPVDYRTSGRGSWFRIRWNFYSGMSGLRHGLHEWIGLIVYWALDRSDDIFPGPRL